MQHCCEKDEINVAKKKRRRKNPNNLTTGYTTER